MFQWLEMNVGHNLAGGFLPQDVVAIGACGNQRFSILGTRRFWKKGRGSVIHTLHIVRCCPCELGVIFLLRSRRFWKDLCLVDSAIPEKGSICIYDSLHFTLFIKFMFTFLRPIATEPTLLNINAQHSI